jgi:PIN domain nuclease of toxin-antitoxin system
MRVLLDTHIFIWYAKEQDKLSKDVLSILSDYENEVYVSSETLKELVVLWNKRNTSVSGGRPLWIWCVP